MAFGINFSAVRNRQVRSWPTLLNPIFGLREPKGPLVREVHSIRATYNFGTDGGAIGTHNLGVVIPKNAIITKVTYDVITTFTTAGSDAGTIAIVAGATNLVTAIAVSDVSNPWDAGIHAGIQLGTAATMSKITVDSELAVVLATQAVTAGKMAIFVEYEVSE